MQAAKFELQIIEGAERTVLVLRNAGSTAIGRNWRLYNSFGLTALSEEVLESVGVEGRFGYLAPGSGFPELAPGASIEVAIKPWIFAGNRLIDRQGFHLTVLEGNSELIVGQPRVLPARLLAHDVSPHAFIAAASPHARTELMTPLRDFARFASKEAAQDQLIIPAPARVENGEGDWAVGLGSAVYAPKGLAAEAAWLRDALAGLGLTESAKAVTLKIDADVSKAAAGYSLAAGSGGVEVRGASAAGVFAGLQSLLQLAALGLQRGITVRDEPTYEFRSVYLDIARHFPGRDVIERLIRCMARYKLNVLVLGISNDEGWRLEIPEVPELTAVGGVRRFDPEDDRAALLPALGDEVGSTHSGYLSRDDFISLLRLAARHHVEVIPEFNLPGHSNALIRALVSTGRFAVTDPGDRSRHPSHQGYEQNTVNPCVAGTYQFAREVISSIAGMYSSADLPFRRLHCGGDETPPGTWLESPSCTMTPGWNPDWSDRTHADAIRAHVMRHHFSELVRVAREVAPELELGFWHEMAPYADPGIAGVWFNDWTTYSGQSDARAAMAAGGQPVVISNASYLYFDMPYGFHPDEPGLPWATYIDSRGVWEFEPASVSEGLKNIAGLQAQLWSETVYAPEMVDFYLFPRLLAFAERCWNRPDSARTWAGFAAAAGRELRWLDGQKMHYRIAPPGIEVRDGLAHVLTEFPGQVVRYSNHGEPDATAPVCTGPTVIGSGLWFRTWSGTRSSRSVYVGAA